MWMTPSIPTLVSIRLYKGGVERNTAKRSDHPQQSYREDNSRVLPSTQSAHKGIPDKGVGVARGHNDEDSDGHGQEDDVHDPDADLDQGEQTTREDVDDDGNQQHGPHEQRTMPSLRLILGMIQHHHALDLGADEEGRDSDEGAPGEDGDPSLEETDEARTPRREDITPVILGSSRGMYRCQLCQ